MAETPSLDKVRARYARKADVFRNHSDILRVTKDALEARRDEIDPETEDPYEQQLGLMITLQLDLLSSQIKGALEEMRRYSHLAVDTEAPRG